jgi:hypothetical protein
MYTSGLRPPMGSRVVGCTYLLSSIEYMSELPVEI